MAEGTRESEGDRRFWQQVAQMTEAEIAPPKDGWQRISARIDAETRAAEPAPPPTPPGERGIRLPGVLVWVLGSMLLIVMFVLASQAQPAPLPPSRPVDSVTPPGPADTATRRMRIEWLKPPLLISRKTGALRLTYRITNVGTGKIVLPGPATSSRHYFLTVRHGEKQWQYPLVASAADRVLTAGGARAIGDLSADQALDPYEALSIEVLADVGTLMPDEDLGQYHLTIRYAPPASSERTSPPETDSTQIQVTVVK